MTTLHVAAKHLLFSKRSIRYPMFELFDQPDMVSYCARRNQSTIATQALLL